MIYFLNGFLILLLLLIAYWWANQGLFSAFLHLTCVIVAGAIAFAFWEPVTINLLMQDTRFDDYAWGVSLLGLFAVSLLVLRIGMDRLIRANVALPDWANLGFGFVVGLGSAILTLGIAFIGAGHMQSHRQIAGYEGWGVNRRTAQIDHIGPTIWVPVHQWTNDFYNALSVGALHPTFEGRPLLHYNPDVFRQATLLRDSFDHGRGKFSLLPEAAKVLSFHIDEDNRHYVTMEFGPLARDFGQQMTLSRSQVRLVTRRPANSRSRPSIVFPDAWWQETSEISWGRFLFDDPSHYISSVPGRDTARVTMEFPVRQGEIGRFIQIRGTRFILPSHETGRPGDVGAPPRDPAAIPQLDVGEGNRIDHLVDVSNSTRPVNAHVNRMPGTLRHADRQLTEGRGTFASTGTRPPPALRVNSIFEPSGTRAVMIDVSRGTAADIYGDVRARVTGTPNILLIDTDGNQYAPVGYIHEHRDGVTIELDPVRFLRTADRFPLLPTAGTDRLRIIFYVTIDATVAGLMYGDLLVGTCNVPVTRSLR